MHKAWLEQCILPTTGKFIVVGDLQNGYGVLPYLEDRKDFTKIFIGDFLDSYHASPAKQVQYLETVLGMVDRTEAIMLLGNHEAQYFGPNGLRTSSWNSTTAMLLMPLKHQIEKAIRPFVYHEPSRTLFSHAGLAKSIWESYNLGFDTLAHTLHAWSMNLDSPFYFIGRTRGGDEKCGGPLWCDWHDEFAPVEGLAQVVGHTASFNQKAWKDGDRIGNLRVKNASWNVDCLGKDTKTFDLLVFDTAEGFTAMQVPK